MLADYIQSVRMELCDKRPSSSTRADACDLLLALEMVFMFFADDPDKIERAQRFFRNSLQLLHKHGERPTPFSTSWEEVEEEKRKRMAKLLKSLLESSPVQHRIPTPPLRPVTGEGPRIWSEVQTPRQVATNIYCFEPALERRAARFGKLHLLPRDSSLPNSDEIMGYDSE